MYPANLTSRNIEENCRQLQTRFCPNLIHFPHLEFASSNFPSYQRLIFLELRSRHFFCVRAKLACRPVPSIFHCVPRYVPFRPVGPAAAPPSLPPSQSPWRPGRGVSSHASDILLRPSVRPLSKSVRRASPTYVRVRPRVRRSLHRFPSCSVQPQLRQKAAQPEFFL